MQSFGTSTRTFDRSLWKSLDSAVASATIKVEARGEFVSMATATPEATAACTPVDQIIAALRRVEALDGLTEQDYLWLAENGTEQKLSAGQEVFQEGDPADRMTILLKGEVHVRRRERGSVAFFISRV